ncbi:hypothetical protein DFJ77DRAFT_362823 [Powellomyces hirtus]|nr:hypothetical protein DFJ77DRAFT_362823 [Powellomyces hirtus]
MPDKQITEFIIDLLRVGLKRLSLVPAELKSSFEVQSAIAAQELAVDVLASIGAAERASTLARCSMDVESELISGNNEPGPVAPAAAPSPTQPIAIPKSADVHEVEERALILAPPSKRTKRPLNGMVSRMPQELLLHIFEMVEDLSTLHSCCLVSRNWNPVAQEVLWREVLLDSGPRLRKFVRGVAFSATPRIVRRAGRNRAGLAVPKSFEGIGEYLKPGLIEFANGARRLSTVVGNRAMLPMASEPTNAFVSSPPASLSLSKCPTAGKGLGSMVKKLVVSSSEQKVILLQHVGNLLNNLQSLQFQHLNYEGSGPSLDARILNSLESVIHRVSSLTVEDVDCPCWPELCRILRDHGGMLRNLNIEAVKDIDAFESSSDMSDVFPHMAQLEYLRLDGIPVGPNTSIERLVTCCKNLQAITLDYCLDVTMDVLMLLWNGCPNMSFLGMAGVVGPLSLPLVLDKRPSLKTLRLVDCDVFDEMFEEVALKATHLEMLRLVFEDDGCEGIVTVSTELTDRSLNALANHNTTLRIIALTRCPNMSAQALARVIRRNPVHTLDLHKHPECSIGGLDDQFLRDLGQAMQKVEVLNLYGQMALTEQCIVEVANQGLWTGLKSISINNLSVGPVVLDAIREGCPRLEVISIVDCLNIAAEAAQGFTEGRAVYAIKAKQQPRTPDSNDGSTAPEPTRNEQDDGIHLATLSPPDDLAASFEDGESDFLGDASAMSPAQTDDMRPEVLDHYPYTLPPTASYLAPRSTRENALDPHNSSSSRAGSPDTRSFYTPEPEPIHLPVVSDEHLAPLPRLRRVYTLAQDAEENNIIKRCDCWFVDEGLDIMSLWENAIRTSAGRGWVY